MITNGHANDQNCSALTLRALALSPVGEGALALPHFGPAFVRETSDAWLKVRKIGKGCGKHEAAKLKSGARQCSEK